MRFSLPSVLALLFAVSASVGCTTRYRVPSRALGTDVSVVADHDARDRSLRVEVSAGEFPVRSVELVDARGRVLQPASAVQRGDELRGGVRVGGGFGFGGGGFDDHKRLRLSSGVSRTVGGRLVPGPLVARFLDPPLRAQPWTLRVTTGGSTAVRTEVLLAELKNRREIEEDPAAPRAFKLVTGETECFVPGPAGGPRYEPVDESPPLSLATGQTNR